MSKGKVGIVGSGTIGRGWIILFARAGYQVSVFDEMEGAVENALEAVAQSMVDMQELGLMEDVDAARNCITTASSLHEAVGDTVYVQESVHEDRAVKEKVFLAMDEHAPADTILASSCSASSLSACNSFSIFRSVKCCSILVNNASGSKASNNFLVAVCIGINTKPTKAPERASSSFCSKATNSLAISVP